LATTDDARVHCAVLKIRAVPEPHHQLMTRIRSDRGVQPKRPFPQDPTACSARITLRIWRSMSQCDRTNQPGQLPRPNNQCSTNELAT